MPKKDFKSNPSLQFISADESTTDPQKVANQVPDGYRKNPAYIEKRDQRINLLITRSAKEKLRDMSLKTGHSVNDLINKAIENYIQG